MKDSRASVASVDASDRAFESLRQIETIAGLLEARGARVQDEPVDADLVADAAFLIGQQTQKLRAYFRHLEPRSLAAKRKLASEERE